MNRVSVLLIDDDDEDYLITEHLLLKSKTSSYQVHWQPSYDEALVFLENNPVDIVLVDYFLGNKNGIEFIQELQTREIKLPVILLTGLGNYETDLAAMNSGAADYLNKNELTAQGLERSIRYAIKEFQTQQKLKELTQELEDRVQQRTQELNTSNQILEQNQQKLQILYKISGSAHREISLTHFLNEALQRLAMHLEANCAAISIPKQSKLSSLVLPENVRFCGNTGQPGQENCALSAAFEALLQRIETEFKQDSHACEPLLESSDLNTSQVWKQAVYQQDQLLFIMYFALETEKNASPDLQTFMSQVCAQISTVLQQYFAVQLIRNNEERLKQFLEAIPVGVYILEENGLPFYLNRTAKEILGEVKTPHDHRNLAKVYQAYQEGTDQFYPGEHAPIQCARRGQDTQVDDMIIRRPDRNIHLQVWGRAIKDAQERVLYAISTFSDISEVKQTEKALILAREKAEGANRAKSDFLAHMSHEIRTPMNAILGFAQLLQQDVSITLEQQKKLKVIVQSGEHLLSLLNDILEMSKIEAGHVQLEPECVDIYQILSELESVFVAKFQSKNLDLSVSTGLNLPRHLILDKQKLRQVLYNLLSNAFKFTHKGQVKVLVKATKPENGSCELTFKVEDTGVGIASEELHKVFQSFEQTSSGRNTQGGTGLGLAISQKFISMMGGEIKVTSTPGSGTTFAFNIQVLLAENTDSSEPEQAPHFDFSALKNPRVLVVDDQSQNRDLLHAILKPHGFHIREAENGAEALKLVAEEKPDLILLDLSMPVMNGLTCLKELRKQPKGDEFCIIVITANAFVSDRQKSLLTGATDFIAKPFKINEVLSTIANHLGQASTVVLPEPFQGESAPAPDQTHSYVEAPALSTELLQELAEATICGDQDQILDLIEKIPQTNSALAQQLSNWASMYQYEDLLNYLDEALKQAQS